MTVGGQTKQTRFLITGLGRETVILGLPWLKETNPLISWKNGTLEIEPEDNKDLDIQRLKPTPKQMPPTIEEMPDEEPQQQGGTLNTDNPFILNINPGWMKTLPEDTLKQTNPGTSERNTVPDSKQNPENTANTMMNSLLDIFKENL
ncbi:hypothetical protein H0H81_009598 [Sphagnurus paluster]|uniref:Uncharacterized protein n=1 Tax=Sphagnurus paluster TaxID=117069 RepID=A0A9P7G7P7_9AGAR|nr:hypothetical protein H0H81_009598 [Sphagnurus paluster]